MSTAHLQISHADIILLNKTDLVSAAQLSEVQQRLLSINELAHIVPTERSVVKDLSGTVLDLQAYSTFPSVPQFQLKGHSHLDPSISTATIILPVFDLQKLPMLEAWLQLILWDDGQEKPFEIHRTKGYVPVNDGTARVIQGVREIFETIEVEGRTKESELETQGKIVFIGRDLESLPSGPSSTSEA